MWTGSGHKAWIREAILTAHAQKSVIGEALRFPTKRGTFPPGEENKVKHQVVKTVLDLFN